MLQVGVLGAGTMGRMHASAIANSKLARVAKIFSPEPDGEVLARDVNAKAVTDANEIFDDSSIDTVVIASPPDLHAEHLRRARATNKNILCEKPLVRTPEEADEIEKLFAGYTKAVSVGHVLHFMPEYRHLKNTIESGALGQIGTIRFGRCGFSPAHARPWFGDFKRSGGVIVDLMLHDLDILAWCFGNIEHIFAMRSGGTGQIVEDYAIAIARLKSGAIAHLEASWMEAPETFYFYYEIAGAKGLIDYDSRTEPTLVFRSKERTPGKLSAVPVMQSPSHESPYEAQMRSFLERVTAGEQPEVTLADGLRTVRLALAVLKSSAENKPVAP